MPARKPVNTHLTNAFTFLRQGTGTQLAVWETTSCQFSFQRAAPRKLPSPRCDPTRWSGGNLYAAMRALDRASGASIPSFCNRAAYAWMKGKWCLPALLFATSHEDRGRWVRGCTALLTPFLRAVEEVLLHSTGLSIKNKWMELGFLSRQQHLPQACWLPAFGGSVS